jgi:hypothetical protein
VGFSHIGIPPASTFVQVVREIGAGCVYADAAGYPRIDYQTGSIRDEFDFGPVLAVSVETAREAGIDSDWKWGGLYDLRLRISEKRSCEFPNRCTARPRPMRVRRIKSNSSMWTRAIAIIKSKWKVSRQHISNESVPGCIRFSRKFRLRRRGFR